MCTIGPPRRPACRICFDEAGELVSPCACRGSSGVVHVECLTKWALAQRASASGKWSHFVQCELCKSVGGVPVPLTIISEDLGKTIYNYKMRTESE